MSYKLVYHPEVLNTDIRKINRNIQRIIKRAIERRLLVSPQSYGHPLSGNLSGFWKLRVGDYRIIFKVLKDEIGVYGIFDRKNAYFDILRRIP